MPCMGPTPPDEQDIDLIYRSVLEFIRVKHCLLVAEDPFILRKQRKITLIKLKKAIEEVIWQDRCEGF